MINRVRHLPLIGLVIVMSGSCLAACGHSAVVADENVAPRTFSEFELVEARNNRDRLRTLNQLKTKRASAD